MNLSINISVQIQDEQQACSVVNSLNSLLSLPGAVVCNKSAEREKELSLYIKDRCALEEISESTRMNRYSTVMWLEKFFPNLCFEEIGDSFIESFKSRLREMGISVNTIAKHVSHLRIYMMRAAREGLLSDRWLDHSRYQSRRTPHKHCFLTTEELRLFENLNINELRSKERMICIAFLFCCYTGLRFSDIRILRNSDIMYIDGVTLLNITMKKTTHDVYIPISILFGGKAERLLESYRILVDHPDGYLFPLRDNSYVNKVLKKLGSRLKVTKNMSFHVARHTFATQCLSYKVPIEIIQKLLGHTNIKTTQIYAEMTPRTLLNVLESVHWQS